ncbi:hypothetical protein MKA43_09605 [[Clostridium] innocuum]|nr:hypothetical protein [[Clostridium] innocuum]
MGTTSAGSIQMDLEIKSDLDKDIQAESSKIADRIRKQVDAMSGDMFKNLRLSLVASLDKMNESIKATLNRTKLEMQAFVEQMAGMVKQMSGVQMPYQKAQNDTEPSTTASQGPSVRGPPVSIPKIKIPKMTMDTASVQAQMANISNQISVTTEKVSSQKAQLQQYYDELDNVNEIRSSFATIRNEIAQNQQRIKELTETAAGMKKAMREATTISGKIALNDQLKSVESEIQKCVGDIKYLKMHLEQLSGVDTGRAITTLTSKIANLKKAISGNESNLMNMKAAFNDLQESQMPIKFPDFPELALPVSTADGFTSIANKVASTSGAFNKARAAVEYYAKSIGGLKGKVAGVTLNSLITGLERITNSAKRAGKALASTITRKFGNGLKSAGQHAASFASRLLGIGSASKKASNGMGRAHMGVGQLIKSFTIFSLIFPLVSRGIMALAQNIGATLMTNTAFANSLNQIRSNLATAFTPIFQAIMPALNALMSALATVTGYIAAFMSALFGKSMSTTKQATSGIYAAKDAMGAYGSSADKAAKASEKARRSLMGFDEINKLDDADTSAGSGGGGGGGSDMPVYTPTDVDDGPIKKWVKQLKDLWAKGDYDGIGKLIGQQVNKAVASFTKWISWDNLGKSITEFCDGFCELFNSLIDTINWENIGRMFGTGINTIVNTLYLLFTGINWERIGKALAQGLNGLVYSVDWDKLGHTIGSFLQAHIDALYGFVTTADWPAIGKALADGVMGLVYSVDLPKFTESLGKGLSGAISSVHTFVENINWTKLGDTIAKSINAFFSNINWADFGMTLSDAALGILDTLLTALQGIDWGQIGKSIGTFLSNIDWWGIISKVGSAIWEAFSGVITSLFNSGSGTVFLALLAGIKGLKSVFSMIDLKGAALNFVSGGLKSLASLGTGILKDVLPKVASGVQTLLGSGGLGKIVSGVTGIVAKAGPILSSIGSVVFSPTGLLIGGVAAGVALIVTHWDDIKKAAKNVAKWVGEKWDDVKKWTSEKWGKISKNLSDTWSDLKKGASDIFGKIGDKISEVWNGSDKNTESAWGSIKGVVADSIDTVRNDVSINSEKAGKAIEKNFNNARDSLIGANRGMSNDTKNAWGPLVTFMSDKCGSIKNDISRTFKDSKNTVDTNSKGMKSSVTGNLSDTTKWIAKTMYNEMYDKAKNMMDKFKKGSGAVNVKSTVQSCVGTATSWLSGLGGSSYSWGNHMISGFANGISENMWKVAGQVKNAADIVASWLHFTRPDTGPLREYEQWMPHMMEGLGKTLAASTPRFIGQVKSLSQSMSGAMQAALQEPTIAFAGERSLNVQHEWKESQSDTDKTTMKDLIEEVRGLKQKFDEVKEEIRNKDTDVYIDDQKVTKKVVDNVNKDTRKNGKCPIDM